jgi:hypothetical protein
VPDLALRLVAEGDVRVAEVTFELRNHLRQRMALRARPSATSSGR